jgi:diaminohydroxyphosphoribosylaminopyrimidine deaminase/5-amino-6-(5-phosphoribosylamino)uracil reductase
MSVTAAEEDAMRRAIAISAFGLGSTSPNPPVGCVILDRTGRPVGEGYHRRKGEPHAEVNALTAAGSRAAGGTAVVTLEPCNHHGRTPPCHQALIDAGIERVLIAVIDPTSRGEGGAARLRDAGVDVEVGVLADETLIVLGSWLDALRSGRPRIVWAYEAAPDGPLPLPHDLLARTGMLSGIDAVLWADGRVEEIVPGAHGRDAFALPGSVRTADPEEAITTLYGGGVRSLVLAGGAGLAEPFASRQLLDEVRMLVRESTAGPPPSDVQLAPGLLIRSVCRLDIGVLVTAARGPGPPAAGWRRPAYSPWRRVSR